MCVQLVRRSLGFALAASAQELHWVSNRVEVHQWSHMGMCSSVSRLGTEVFASGSAQFEIQGGREEPEIDKFLLTKILEVAQMREAKIETQCEMGAYMTATDFNFFSLWGWKDHYFPTVSHSSITVKLEVCSKGLDSF